MVDPWLEMRRLQREMEHLVTRMPAWRWPLRGEYPPLNVVRDAKGIVVDSTGALALYEHSPALVWMLTAAFGVVAAALILFGGGRDQSR